MFNKDILIVDIEATGVDFNKHELIELGAVLLDKKTLKQKKSFQSFIKPKRWKDRDPEAMAVNNISWDALKKAPSLKSVLQKFESTFGTDVIIAPYGTILDTALLRVSYRESKMAYTFDYHVYDIWPLAYTYMAKNNLLTNAERFSGFSLEDIAKHFKIPTPQDRHTALSDCRLEAAVLRKLIKAYK